MKRLPAVLCLSLASLFFCPAKALSQGFGFGPPTTLNVDAASDSFSEVSPLVMSGQDSRFLAIWRGPGNDLYYTTSDDAGMTWSSEGVFSGTMIGTDERQRLATDSQGVWVVVWVSSVPFGGMFGTDTEILFVQSSDNGDTWTAPAIVNDYAPGGIDNDLDPRIITDGDGTFITFWRTTYNDAGAFGSDFDIYFARSTDDGATWSAAAPLNADALGDTKDDSTATGAFNDSGACLAAWTYQAPSSDTNMDVALSLNGGALWSAPTTAATFTTYAGVTDVAFLGGQEWLIFLATGDFGSDGDMAVIRSTDNGATWGPAFPINDDAFTDGLSDYSLSVVQESPTKFFAAWTREVDTGFMNPPFVDRNIFGARSVDGGLSWTSPARLNSNMLETTGTDNNPSVARDAGGNWVLVWFSGESLGGTVGDDFDILISLSNSVPVELSHAGLE